MARLLKTRATPRLASPTDQSPESDPEAGLVSGPMEAGECNAHHVTVGDSKSRAQALSIDTGTEDLGVGPTKSGKAQYQQWLMEFSGAWGTDCGTCSLAVSS